MPQPQPNHSLSACQQRWLEHLRTCEQREISIQRYAAEQQLSPGAMYAAKRALKRRGVLGDPSLEAVRPGKSLTLVPVKLQRAPAQQAPVLRVTVRGGVTLELFEGAGAHITEQMFNAVIGRAL
jgi:hypothetical protein